MGINSIQIRFFVVLLICFILLNFFFQSWIAICAPGGIYWEFAANYLNFIQSYRHFLIWGTGMLCELFNLRYLTNDTQILIIGHGGVTVVYSCLGYGIISFLTAFGIATPHQKIKDRILYTSIAILLFSFLNMIRFFTLSFYAGKAKRLAIDHHTIFNIICYIIILFGIYIWINRTKRVSLNNINT